MTHLRSAGVSAQHFIAELPGWSISSLVLGVWQKRNDGRDGAQQQET